MFGICRLASVVFSRMSFRGCFVGLTSFSSLLFLSVFFVSFVFVCAYLLCCPFLRFFSSQLELSSITFQLLVHLRSHVSFCEFLGFLSICWDNRFLKGSDRFGCESAVVAIVARRSALLHVNILQLLSRGTVS